MVSLLNHEVVAGLVCPTSWFDKLTMRSHQFLLGLAQIGVTKL